MVNRKRALRAMAVAGVVLMSIVVSCTHRSDQPGRPARVLATASTPQPSSPVSVSPRSTVSPDATPDADELLPFTDRRITAAADLATHFTAAYASHRFDESPQAYLDRLAPMMSAQLQPVIAQAAADPAMLEQRRQRREVTTAQARAEAIRALGPTSITVLLTATSQTTAGQPAEQQTAQRETTHRETRYAVTVVPRDGGWRVYAIELAATGDAGSGNEANRP